MPIITDLESLRMKSEPTSRKEVDKLQLKDQIKEALEFGWTRGFGLAAIQVGVPLQYAWYTFRGREVELINPKITKYAGPCLSQQEGCLSIPNTRIDTIRYAEIEVESEGKTFSASGIEAFIIQHELDHMHGVLIYDRAQNPYPKLGRNDPCGCGSGKKYKKCCLK